MELFARKVTLQLLTLNEQNKLEVFKNKTPRKIQLKEMCRTELHVIL
jgi:hypothetical protein